MTTLLLGIGGVIDELVRHGPVNNTFKYCTSSRTTCCLLS